MYSVYVMCMYMYILLISVKNVNLLKLPVLNSFLLFPPSFSPPPIPPFLSQNGNHCCFCSANDFRCHSFSYPHSHYQYCKFPFYVILFLSQTVHVHVQCKKTCSSLEDFSFYCILYLISLWANFHHLRVILPCK